MPEGEQPDRIVLVGFMGSGKSTVGGELARLLGWEFRDMDRDIEARTGLTVAEIFRRHGEALFREEEKGLAREIATLRRVVVAAGGGAFTVPETREALRTGALTVWLRCALETVLARISLDGSRPLAPDRETIGRLFAEREPSYRLADCTVETSSALPEAAAREILDILAAAGPRGAAKTSER